MRSTPQLSNKFDYAWKNLCESPKQLCVTSINYTRHVAAAVVNYVMTKLTDFIQFHWNNTSRSWTGINMDLNAKFTLQIYRSSRDIVWWKKCYLSTHPLTQSVSHPTNKTFNRRVPQLWETCRIKKMKLHDNEWVSRSFQAITCTAANNKN